MRYVPESTSPPQALHGRDRELLTVAELLDGLSRGHGAAVLLEGEAGIGRSAVLASAARTAASRGYALAHVAADVLEQGVPLAAARQVLQTLAGDEPDPWCGGHSGSLDGGDPDGDRLYTVFDRWHATVTRRASQRPLLVLIDDLHWCDDQSLRWIAYCLRRCQSMPVGVVAAVRTGHRTSTPVLSELILRLRRLPLTGLNHESSARIARDVLDVEPDDTFIAACQRVTAGNPRLLHELFAEVVARDAAPTAETARRIHEFATPAMAHTLLAEVYRTDPAATSLVHAVAALDGAAEPDLAARLVGLEPTRAVEVTDYLVRRRIFRDGQPLTFVHPLLASAVAREMGAGAVRRARVRAAKLSYHAGRDETEVAEHLVRASLACEPWAEQVLRGAARSALAHGDAVTAVRYLERALREPRPPRARTALLAELGTALLFVDVPAGMKRLTTALAAADDDTVRGQVVSGLANGLLAGWTDTDTLRLIDEAAERVGGRDPGLARRLQVRALSVALLDLARAPEMDRRFAALALADDSQPAVRRAILAARAVQEDRLGASAARAAALARQAVAVGPPRTYEEVVPYWSAVVSLTRAGCLDTVPALCAAADGTARKLGWRLNQAAAAAVRGRFSYLTGRLVDAEQHTRQAFALLTEIGADPDRCSWLLPVSMLVYVLIDRGRMDEAAALLDRAGFADSPVVSPRPLELLAARGLVRLARDDVRASLADLHEYGRGLDALGVRSAGYDPWRAWAALAHHRLGEEAEARWLAAEQLELSRRWGTPRALGVALRASGVVTGGAEGLRLLAEAAAILEAAPARHDLAQVLIDHGVALREAGRRADARERFSRAAAAATECAAESVAARARSELRSTVAVPAARRPRPESPTPPKTALLVRCFNGFRFELSDRPLDWAAIRPRVRTLLRFLAVHAQRPVHRESILAALWPDLPTKAGIRNLHVGISTLRTFLEPGVDRGASRFIRRDGESYMLDIPEGGMCDVRAFDEAVAEARRALAAGRTGAAADALRRALGHYSGDLLPEDGPAEWIAALRDRYRAVAAESAAALAGIELDAGRAEAAVEAARRSVELDGFRDDAWRTLLAAYRRSGDAAAAEQTWRAYQAMLWSLGVDHAGRVDTAEEARRAGSDPRRLLDAHGRLKNSTSPMATRRPGASP